MSPREHGTRSGYQAGCDCYPCRDAQHAYMSGLRADLRAGRRRMVDNTEAREHIAWLRSVGVGLPTIAERTGLPKVTLWRIASGRAVKSRPALIDKVCSVGRSAVAPGAYVDSSETWRMIDAIRGEGYRDHEIARMLGRTGARPQLFRRRPVVTAATARKVEALHWELMRPVLVERENQNRIRQAYRVAQRERERAS